MAELPLRVPMSALLHMSAFEHFASCACTLEEACDEPAIAARGADNAVLYSAALAYFLPESAMHAYCTSRCAALEFQRVCSLQLEEWCLRILIFVKYDDALCLSSLTACRLRWESYVQPAPAWLLAEHPVSLSGSACALAEF